MVTAKKNGPLLRDDIEAFAVFYASRAGYYDTRLDFSSNEPRPKITLKRLRLFLPPGATHRFIIQVEYNRYLVTRYEDNWTVDFADKTEAQKRERLLREGVLSKALHYFAEGMAVPLEDGGEKAFIDQLLSDERVPEGELYAEGVRGISGHHPIVRDESPFHDMRHWSVTVGAHLCSVGLAKDTPEPEFVILPL